MTIEDNVNKLLKLNNLTKQELAKRLNITYQSLWATINGNPRLKTLQEIAKALNCDICDLLNTDYQEFTNVCPHCKKPIKISVNLE